MLLSKQQHCLNGWLCYVLLVLSASVNNILSDDKLKIVCLVEVYVQRDVIHDGHVTNLNDSGRTIYGSIENSQR